jgi:hypothetical protein
MGHIHIGYDKSDDNTNIELIKYLDLFLGVPAIIMDNDDRRKEIYGTAGRFRPTSFGLEYRTLSNFWVSSIRLQHWAFNAVYSAINAYNNKLDIKEYHNSIVECINTNNKEMAHDLINAFNLTILITTNDKIKKDWYSSLESR